MRDAYRDLIGLCHPEPKTVPRMPIEMRAAQFAPFAALTGYDEAVEETARYTDTMPELAEEMRSRIGETLLALQNEPEATVYVHYFVPDFRKEGGMIASVSQTVRKLDPYRQMLWLADGTTISFSMILSIQRI